MTNVVAGIGGPGGGNPTLAPRTSSFGDSFVISHLRFVIFSPLIFLAGRYGHRLQPRPLHMNAPSRRVVSLLIVLSVGCAGARLNAQNVRNIAEHELARRQAGVVQGQAALARGQIALQAKDFAKAYDEYRVAVTFLPDALATAADHDAAMTGFCESGVKVAEQRIAEGKYGEAEQIVREIVSDRYNPNCHNAAELLAHLSEPGYYNRTMGPKFIARVEDVKQLLV